RRPLLCLQHFTGTLDNWDPAVTDPLGDGREVILFDSAGVGRSTGPVPPTVAGMAAHALQFLDGLCVTSCDVLGFSLGGMVAQQMALDRPSSIHRMILVGRARPRRTRRPAVRSSSGLRDQPTISILHLGRRSPPRRWRPFANGSNPPELA